MSRTLLFIVVFLLARQAGSAQKSITLDDCFVFYKFYPQSGDRFQYRKDGQHYTTTDDKGLHIYDIRNERFDSLIPLKLPKEAEAMDQFDFSDDEKKLVVRTGTEPVYRHSILANYFVYDFATAATMPVFEAAKQQFIDFSPDGSKIAFIADNDLYYRDLTTGKITQITSDGEKNTIINGLPDWVYEEEFSPVEGEGMVATRWSPDGTKIAFLRFDESKVPEMALNYYEGEAYPRQTTFKYPKVGQANSVVTAHIYDLATRKIVQADTGTETDQYLPRIHWTPGNRLVVTRLNRQQNELTLWLIDNNTGYSTTIFQENDAAYVDVESGNKLLFLKSGGFMWMSEQSGYNHVRRYSDLLGDAGEDLTPGNFDITAFYGVDEQNRKFYYQTATPTPMDRQVWEGSLDRTAPRLLTPKVGTNDAAFSPTFDFYTLTWQDRNTPPVVTLCDRSGATLRTITDNRRVAQLRKEYGFANKEFFDFKLADGTVLNGWMIKPANFDPSQKYPVLFDNYGGPNSQTVQNQYDGYIGSWHQMLAQKGIIIVSVDNRGTGGRGRDFRKCTQLQLGKYETEDQIAAARYLGTLPYVNAGRIGIWGWSFGGYLSTSCILKGNDVFRMAMAVAPVTNWKWYDSAYTERYMHTTADNSKGYEDNSPINFADRLRGGNYLICHGIADDNVHWQQTTEMMNALIKANKQFQTYYYPNRNHGIYGDNATRHLFTKLTDFVLEKL